MKQDHRPCVYSAMLRGTALIIAATWVSSSLGQTPLEGQNRPMPASASGYYHPKSLRIPTAKPEAAASTRRVQTTGSAGVASSSNQLHTAYLESTEPGEPQYSHAWAGGRTGDLGQSKLLQTGFDAQETELPNAQTQSQDEKQSAERSDAWNSDNDQEESRAFSRDISPTWVRKPIREVRVDIRELATDAPVDRSTELNYGMGDWSQFYCEPKVFAWWAPDIRYQPLFFEDVALERYGQTLGFHRQTIRSGVHFFKSAITFPNKMRHDSPWSCDYPLGFCRPGSCVPGIKQKHYLGHPN